MGNELTFSEVKRIIGEYMKIALNVVTFDITFAKRETLLTSGKDVWRINVEYKKSDVQTAFFSNTVAITMDAKNGEIISFEKDKIWKM